MASQELLASLPNTHTHSANTWEQQQIEIQTRTKKQDDHPKGIVTLHPVRKLCLAHFLDSFESGWHLLNCVWSVVATSLKTVDCSFECARRKPRKLKNETRVLHKKQQKWTSDSLFHVFLSEISWLREGIRVAGSYWELATNPSLMLALEASPGPS